MTALTWLLTGLAALPTLTAGLLIWAAHTAPQIDHDVWDDGSDEW